ncbi:hypothetical protein EJB05_27471, partial [Eragrostis curvula]
MADLVFGLAKTAVEGTVTMVKSAMEEEERLKTSVRRDLMLISDEFEMMNSFINAANDGVVDNVTKTSVRQVRDMALDVEDCIESVINLDNKSIWWRRLLPRWLPAAAPVVALDDAIAGIELLKARVEAMGQRNMRYSHNVGSSAGSKPQQPVASTKWSDILVDEMDAAGKRAIPIDLVTLINRDKVDGAVQVIAVSGEVGTMSVIKKAYDNVATSEKFTCRAWVKLMHPFSPHDFIRSLLAQFCKTYRSQNGSSVSNDVPEPMEVTVTKEDVLIKFMKQLSNHKYLVVLENVSTIVDWETVRVYLPDKSNGSCIVVHTQEIEIARLSVGHQHRVSEMEKYSADHPVYVFFKEDDLAQGESSVHMSAEANSLDIIDTVGRNMDLTSIGFDSALKGNADVFSVWGIAGAGKSYLVRHMHFFNKVSNNYTMVGWVNVSHPFNLSDLSWNLLLDLHSGFNQHDIMLRIKNPIQECREVLRKNKCFVVLDGLQSKEEWDWISSAFASGSSETHFVVITNEESVATYCAFSKEAVWNIRCLDAGHSLELFQKKVLQKTGCSDLNPEVTEKAKLILDKCGGIPKVIVAIADVVAARLDKKKKEDENELSFWEGLKQAFVEGLAEALRGGKDAKVLKLFDEMLSGSFMHMLETNPAFGTLHGLFAWLHTYFRSCPDYLKPCIFYLSIFPVNHRIRRRRLVRRWIAESYARDNKDSTAAEFFHKLVKLSMIQLPESTVKATESMDFLRMSVCQVNGFFHEYLTSRSMDDNLVFALEGHGRENSKHTGRHLAIQRSWHRDQNVFQSIDFSKLRSLTVFGQWESFFISDKMRLLRVLDLEDTSGIENDDLKQILKTFRRLKFLSLRRCNRISHLPDSLGGLKQLQTLDIRDTPIRKIPTSVIMLEKLQYIRAGTSSPLDDDSSMVGNLPLPPPAIAAESSPTSDGNSNTVESLPPPAAAVERASLSKPSMSDMLPTLLSKLSIHGQQHVDFKSCNGIKMPGGIIGKLCNLHTLGVVDISAASREAILKEIKGLGQLRKLGVSGINKKNIKELSSAISSLQLLESLSVQFDKENNLACCFDDTIPLPKNLRSLKLNGLESKLSAWIKWLPRLKKLNLQMTELLPQEEIDSVGKLLPELCSLCLRLTEVEDGKLCLDADLDYYRHLSFLEIACNSRLKAVKFRGLSLEGTLEVLKIRCTSVSSSLQFSDLNAMSALREVWLSGSYEDGFKKHLESQLHKNTQLQVWFKVLSLLGLQDLVPRRRTISFAEWWLKTIKRVPKSKRKGTNILIILTAWLLWKHGNSRVFDSISPNIATLLRCFNEEHHLWCLAGARGLRTLGVGQAVGQA